MAAQPIEYFVAHEEAASFLKVSVRRVKEMARSGKIPAHPVDPTAAHKDWRFLLSELSECMRSRRNKGR
jgi:hypothetical protein